MGKYRCRHDIIADILRYCLNHPERAGVLCLCGNLGISYRQYKRYVNLLVKNGLLKVEAGVRNKVHSTTDKGKVFLALYRRLEGMLNESRKIHYQQIHTSST